MGRTTAVPRHIAIIMDGNGRWASERGLPRVLGHRAGVETIRSVVSACSRRGIEVLTLYAFSNENWRRPRAEVTALMHLLEIYLQQELPSLARNNVRLNVIGQTWRLPASAQQILRRSIAATRRNTGLVLNLAISYSGRAEIVDAVRRIADKVRQGRCRPEQITERLLARHLDTARLPDPDLLIRTSGEMRVSNFLLWQLSYTELYVTPTLWPDFRAQHLAAAIAAYRRRERRFGR
jgi:undecaprenyl diphosphate synthase